MKHARVRVSWLEGGGAPFADRALLRLLGGVRECGSLLGAARLANLSYRHAWGTLQAWSRTLGQPLLRMERGRGATLEPLGETLLRLEQRVQARLASRIEQLEDELERELSGLGRDSIPALRIHASHDLALARLRELASAEGRLRVELQVHGSHASLAGLGRGDCDVAGFHVAKSADGELFDRSLGRWLKPRSHALLRFARREQGLMVKRGNPKHIAGIADLTRRSVRFVNRQSGSGTRVTFDRLIAAAGIEATQIAGYALEEFTHLAVAATVAGGKADAGFGIHAAAAQYGLDFIPVVYEDYFLACPRTLLRSAAMKRLVALLQSRRFRQSAGALPGYDLRAAGTPADIVSLLGSA